MANPESLRVLNDERAILKAEEALASEEQALWKRLDALQAVSLDARAQALLGRVSALESSGAASPDLSRARDAVAAVGAPEPVPAADARDAALQARRGAVSAREAALKGISSAIADTEKRRKKAQETLTAVEQFVSGTEAVLKQLAEQKRQAEELARIQAEEFARIQAARDAALVVAPVVVPPAPVVAAPPPVVVPAPVVVAPPPVVAKAPTAPPKPAPAPVAAVKPKAAPSAKPAPVEARPAPVAAKQPTAPLAPAAKSATKVSRRRRKVSSAPPPRKLEFEVAVYGENNFYTGFENRIAAGGVFIASMETLPQGHELEVEIDLEGKRIKTRGRVEFSRLDNTISTDCSPGAGVRLLSLSSDQTGAIESFFQKRSPMFYTPVQQ